MIAVLRVLLGKTLREQPAKKPEPNARGKPVHGCGDYRAVSIAPGSTCCKAAKDAADKRYLLSEAPHLPLADCTMQTNCPCTYRKHARRRSGLIRRFIGPLEANRWFGGPEQRTSGGRRSTDKR